MDQIPPVLISANGRFKYVLIRLTDRVTKQEKLVVRGNTTAEFHADLVDEFENKLRKLKNLQVDYRCIGGGRIYINPTEQLLNVYGFSQVRPAKLVSAFRRPTSLSPFLSSRRAMDAPSTK